MRHAGAGLDTFGDHSGYPAGMNYADVISEWGEQVPAAQVVKLAGLSYQDVYNLSRRGALRTTAVPVTERVKGPRVRLMISRDDALRLLAAAALAASTAIVLASAFRVLRETGATVDQDGVVTIPVTFPQARQAVAGDVMAA